MYEARQNKEKTNRIISKPENREPLDNRRGNIYKTIQFDKTSWRKQNEDLLNRLNENITPDFRERMEYLRLLQGKKEILFPQNICNAFDRIVSKLQWDDDKEGECTQAIEMALECFDGNGENLTLTELKERAVEKLFIKKIKPSEVIQDNQSPKDLSLKIKEYSKSTYGDNKINWYDFFTRICNYQHKNGYYHQGKVDRMHTTIYANNLADRKWLDSEESIIKAATPVQPTASSTILGLHTTDTINNKKYHAYKNNSSVTQCNAPEPNRTELTTRLDNAITTIKNNVIKTRETKTQLCRNNPFNH